MLLIKLCGPKLLAKEVFVHFILNPLNMDIYKFTNHIAYIKSTNILMQTTTFIFYIRIICWKKI